MIFEVVQFLWLMKLLIKKSMECVKKYNESKHKFSKNSVSINSKIKMERTIYIEKILGCTLQFWKETLKQ